MAPLVSSDRDDGSINTANTISAYRDFLQLTLPMIAIPRAILANLSDRVSIN